MVSNVAVSLASTIDGEFIGNVEYAVGRMAAANADRFNDEYVKILRARLKDPATFGFAEPRSNLSGHHIEDSWSIDAYREGNDAGVLLSNLARADRTGMTGEFFTATLLSEGTGVHGPTGLPIGPQNFDRPRRGSLKHMVPRLVFYRYDRWNRPTTVAGIDPKTVGPKGFNKALDDAIFESVKDAEKAIRRRRKT